MSALSRTAVVAPPATALERAWAAGLFEGEGTITIGKRSSDETYRMQVMVGNTDHQVCEFFFVHWHGWLSPCSVSLKPNRKPAWQWIATADTAAAFLVDVRPYLVTQRVLTKLDLALRFREHQTSSTKRHVRPDYKPHQRKLYEQMKTLNARGLQSHG